MATSTLIIAGSKTKALLQVPYIWYPVQLQEDQVKVKALIDFSSEINITTLAYTVKLGLHSNSGIEAQKIDGLLLETYGMSLTVF